MNPQRAAHMAGPPVALPQADGAGNNANANTDDQGVGSAQSGYAGPDAGPFECGNCIHFEEPNRCNHPQVMSDPEVNGQVEEEGCCNFFSTAGKETQEQEHTEGLAENEQEET